MLILIENNILNYDKFGFIMSFAYNNFRNYYNEFLEDLLSINKLIISVYNKGDKICDINTWIRMNNIKIKNSVRSNFL